MNGQLRLDAILSEIEEARTGAVRQEESAAQQHLDARKAASERVSATQARIQKVNSRASALQEHARQTAVSAGVSEKGQRLEAEVPTPTTGDEAWELLDQVSTRLTQTADELTKARVDQQKKRRMVGQLLVHLGVPLLAAVWAWWVGREPTEAVGTFVVVASAMWTVRKAVTGKARPFAVGLTAIVATYLCMFAIEAFAPAGTMIYFAILLALIGWRYLTLQLRERGRKPAPKK